MVTMQVSLGQGTLGREGLAMGETEGAIDDY